MGFWREGGERPEHLSPPVLGERSEVAEVNHTGFVEVIIRADGKRDKKMNHGFAPALAAGLTAFEPRGEVSPSADGWTRIMAGGRKTEGG
jgi:hypothetical protein